VSTEDQPSAPSQDQADAYELAYDEAVRALSQQQGVLDGFRSRAGILLSAAAIATSFLGGQALRATPSVWSWVAIACFAGLAVSALVILWPRQDWAFAAVPSEIITSYIEVEEPLAVSVIHRDLSLHMENSYVDNERRLRPLILFFRVASALLVVEVAAWVVDLAA
jgi:hypothetical protein